MDGIVDVLILNRRECKVKSQQQRDHQRRAYRKNVKQHQKYLPDEFIPVM